MRMDAEPVVVAPTWGGGRGNDGPKGWGHVGVVCERVDGGGGRAVHKHSDRVAAEAPTDCLACVFEAKRGKGGLRRGCQSALNHILLKDLQEKIFKPGCCCYFCCYCFSSASASASSAVAVFVASVTFCLGSTGAWVGSTHR